jgi:hypothetical protein
MKLKSAQLVLYPDGAPKVLMANQQAPLVEMVVHQWIDPLEFLLDCGQARRKFHFLFAQPTFQNPGQLLACENILLRLVSNPAPKFVHLQNGVLQG